MDAAASSRRLALAIAGALVSALTAACSSDSVTTPSPTPPQTSRLANGPGAFDIASYDEACTAKTPAWGFFGPRTAVPIIISPDGAGWIVRPESDRYGDIEVRITPDTSNAAEVSVTGSARGLAIDLISLISFPNPSRVKVDGHLTGTFLGTTSAVLGSVTGTLVYTDNQGGVMSCTGGTWALFSRS